MSTFKSFSEYLAKDKMLPAFTLEFICLKGVFPDLSIVVLRDDRHCIQLADL